MPDGRSFEHSREQFQIHHAAARERQTHLGAVLADWRRQQAQSETGLPADDGFRPRETVPAAIDFMALIDVADDDMDGFRPLNMGAEAIGLYGFKHGPLLNPVVDRIHCTLLIDLLWAKMERQPSYIETEVIVDEATARYVYCLLPTHGTDGTVNRVYIATRPIFGAKVTLEAFF